MALTGKQASTTLATPERFPTAAEWQQGVRWRRWRKSFPMLCGIALVIVMILVAAMAPWLAPFSPSAQFSEYVLKAHVQGALVGGSEFCPVTAP
jgi:ABC-type antimicrobial peptide transport system permease subunit